MRYRYLVDFRRGISVFAIFSYGIAVLGTPQCPLLIILLPNQIFIHIIQDRLQEVTIMLNTQG